MNAAALPPIQFEVEVVDLDDLHPATGDLQPRDRAGRAASDAQISQMAATLDSNRLHDVGADWTTGAPIIGPDNVIESGNGRLAALRLAYRDAMFAVQHTMGLTAEGYTLPEDGLPVLVRRRITPLSHEQRVGFIAACNRSNVMTMSPSEQAVNDAGALTLADIANLRSEQ